MPWLMKAEPDTRLEKGVDVKFSIDDFEEIGISKWDGVRNHEAKKIMKEKMKVGDEVLFYHSNTKVPGVYGIATVYKEGYPDYTAWDSAHPYFDAKSKQDAPTWFMVDVEFKSRVKYPVTLALLKALASAKDLPESVSYIEDVGFKAIQEMALVNRGRLSVQPVTQEAYDAILLLGEKGGWTDLTPSAGKKSTKRKSKTDAGQEDAATPPQRKGRKPKTAVQEEPLAVTDGSKLQEEEPIRAVKRRKTKEKPPQQDSASESELSDLPSDDVETDGQTSLPAVPTKDVSEEPTETSREGQGVDHEPVKSVTRRSTRQRSTRASA